MSWPFWLEILVRSTALLVAGGALRRFSKAQNAAFRHSLLLWVFALLALLPLFSAFFPEIHIPLWRVAHAQAALVTIQEVSSRAVQAPPRHPMNWPLVAWVAGALIASAPLLSGAISVSRLARRSTPLTARTQRALQRFSPPLSSRSEIRVSSELRVPLTCGFLHPRILLPAAAEHWNDARLQAVLLHELAHVRRRDVAAQVAAHVVAALWWFQPLVWILRRMLRAESEFACDAEALRFGFRPSEYATELLAVAKAIRPNLGLSSSAIAMARSCGLEDRLRAILNPQAAVLRPVRTYALVLALAGMAIAASAVTLRPRHSLNQQGGSTMKRTILAALLASAGLSAATITGTVSDPSGAALPEVNVLISNSDTGAKQEIVTGTDGRFRFDANSAGQYILRLEKPGFASIFREFDVKPDSKIDREFTMANEGGQQVADKVVNTSEDQPKPLRVGGQVAESNLTTKVQPIYPAAAKVDHVQGTVEIEATISKEGVPVELRVLSSPRDDLSQSALEAVGQWRYRPALLNGSPIEIVTGIVVNYTLSR